MADPYGLTAQDNLRYDQGRRKVNSDLSQQLAANAYGRFASQQRFERQNQANKVNWDTQRNRLNGPLLQRGFGHESPLWQGILRNFTQRRVASENNDLANQYDQLRQFDMQGGNYQTNAADALTALEEQRQAQIRDILASLAGAKQFGLS